MKENIIREVVDAVRDTAIEFHEHQSLRERLAYAMGPLIDYCKGNGTPAAPVVAEGGIPEHWQDKAKQIVSGTNLQADERGRLAVMLLRTLLVAKPVAPAVVAEGLTDERAEFQAWLGRPMMNPAQPSHYNGRDVRTGWEAWQERGRRMATLPSAPTAMEVPHGHTEDEDCNCEAVGYAKGWNALLAAHPVAGSPAECTNPDTWNCKYCAKTATCDALKDPRNFGAPVDLVEPCRALIAYCDANKPMGDSLWCVQQIRQAIAAEPMPASEAPEGFALVPLYPTREMQRIMDEEGWAWEDLLAAAEAITEEQYNDIASNPDSVTVLSTAAPGPASEAASVPVAWFTEDHLTDKSATTWDYAVAVRWRAKGWPVAPLYLAAPAAPTDAISQRRAFDAWFNTLSEATRMRTLLAGNREVAWSGWQAAQSVRDAAIEEVANWYKQKGWLLDEDDVPDAIRALIQSPGVRDAAQPTIPETLPLNESDLLRLDWCAQTLRVIADGGRAKLGDAYPEIVAVLGAIETVMQPSLYEPTQPTIAPEDVRDAQRLDLMIAEECRVEHLALRSGTRYRLNWPDREEAQTDWFGTPREAIDSAIAATATIVPGKEGT